MIAYYKHLLSEEAITVWFDCNSSKAAAVIKQSLTATEKYCFLSCPVLPRTAQSHSSSLPNLRYQCASKYILYIHYITL